MKKSANMKKANDKSSVLVPPPNMRTMDSQTKRVQEYRELYERGELGQKAYDMPEKSKQRVTLPKKRHVSLLANEVFGPDVSQQPEHQYNSTVTIVEDSLTPSLPKSSKITAQQRVDEFPGNWLTVRVSSSKVEYIYCEICHIEIVDGVRRKSHVKQHCSSLKHLDNLSFRAKAPNNSTEMSMRVTLLSKMISGVVLEREFREMQLLRALGKLNVTVSDLTSEAGQDFYELAMKYFDLPERSH